MNTNKGGILVAYGTSILGVFSGLLTNLWLIREVTQLVSTSEFGIYAYVFQVSAYLAVLQVGLDFAASRQISEFLGRKDLKQANDAFVCLQNFNKKILLVVIIFLTILYGTLKLGWLINSPEILEHSELASQLMLVSGSAQIIGFLSRPFSAALIGSQYQGTVNLCIVGRTVLTTLLAFILLRFGSGVFCIPIAEVITQLLFWLFLRRLSLQKCEWRDESSKDKINHKLSKSIFRYGGLTAIQGLAWTIESTIDVIILGIFTSPTTVATYVLWWRFPQMLFDLCSRLSWSAFPRFAETFTKGDHKTRILFDRVAALSISLATLSLVGIALWLQPFMSLWLDSGILENQSSHLGLVMGILVSIRSTSNLLNMFWLSTGSAKFVSGLAWMQMLIKVSLAFLLVGKFGILGIVISSCIAGFFGLLGMGYFLNYKGFLTVELVLRWLILATLAIVTASLFGGDVVVSSWTNLFVVTMATTLFWALLCSFVAGSKDLRIYFKTIFFKMLR